MGKSKRAKGKRPATVAAKGKSSSASAAKGAKGAVAGLADGRVAAFPINGVIAIVLMCALVFFQGGYYAGAVCVIGLISTVAFVALVGFRKVDRTCPWQACVLLAIAALYFVSALLHGEALSLWHETITWFAVAGMALWCSFGTLRDKRLTLDALASVGAVLGGLGILMFAGLLPLEGAVNAGRLMFTLQYANTAGLLFAVFAVLCLCSSSRNRRIASIVPIVALLLTQSVGAIGMFVLACLAIGARQLRSGEKDLVTLGIVAAVLVACAIACAMLGGRIAQAQQTFLERIIQMSDALGLLASNPLLGIGPDQWQFAYPAIQTAQYSAADVHCSYLQVALDAGVLAALVVLAFVAFGLWRLARRGEFGVFLCVAMAAVHAVFDFDLQFAAVLMLLSLLVAEPSEGQPGFLRRFQDGTGKVLCWVVATLAVLASCAGVYLDVRAGALQEAVAQGDAEQILERFESAPYLTEDRSMQALACNGLLGAGAYEELCNLADNIQDVDGTVGFQRVLALLQLGRADEAPEIAARTLHDYPYNHELYEAMRQLAVEGDLGAGFHESFDAEAARANELATTGHAAWLGNQETVEPIGDMDPS